MLVQAVRSAVFYLLFLGQTVILAIFVGTLGLILRRRFALGWAIAQYWGNSNLFFLRWVVGIRTRVTDMENIPEGGCIIAAKHQSDWDIFALLPHVGRPAFIAKKELMNIPFFGWAARALDTISIDRSKGSEAIPLMAADAQAALARGCRIIIYPEGTRKAPLEDPAYRWGTAKLYEALNVPVVPVALNSGLFWSRNSLVLWPGLAEAKFLPAIPPGLTAQQMHDRMVASIETETEALSLAAAQRGLTRPISQRLRDRLRELEARDAR